MALLKRFGAICNNYKNLPFTFANLHQVASAGGLQEMIIPVKEEMAYSRGKLRVARDLPFYDIIQQHIEEDSVLRCVQNLSVGGFQYLIGYYVLLPVVLESGVVFGRILDIFVYNEEAYIVTQDISSIYDEKFGAFLIQTDESVPVVRCFITSRLPPQRPMKGWTADQSKFYLCPRTAIA